MPAGEVAWHEPQQGGVAPCPRAGHSVNLVGQTVFLFGGCALQGRKTAAALNDTHVLELGQPGADNARWVEQAINGEPPEGRWRHTATTVDTKIFIFGGLVDDKKRFNDLYVLDTDAFAWRKLNARGTHPAPRAHHTATFTNRQLIVYGGYGGSGRLFSELEALDVDQLQWSVLTTSGQSPKPRYDHTTSLAGNKLVVFGGRDHVQAIEDMCVLDMSTMTWQLMKQDASPEVPVPLYCHVAQAIESAISWKLFTFGGRKGLLDYTNTTFCMDTENSLWIKPPVNTEKSKGPCPREYCASVFDPKSARMLFFGGWANRWLGDVHALDISGIVGPSYAVTGVVPAMGPLSGGREVIVQGINFIQANKIDVKFTNGSDQEIVSGKYLSSTEITCESPSFDKHGAGDVEIKVLFSGEIFTVNRVKYSYYNDTKACGCIAYGPGLTATRTFGTPASFVLQAKDTKARNRTSGSDVFDLTMVLNLGEKEEERFDGAITDNDDGTYICNYIPPAAGVYSIEVSLNGNHIRGSPFKVKCSDPWMRPRMSGTSAKVEEERSLVRSSTGLMTYVPGRSGLDLKDGVCSFDPTKSEWTSAPISGNPPNKAERDASTKFGDTMLSIGGLEDSGMTNDVRILQKEKHTNQWVWSAPVVSGELPCVREGAAAALLGGGKVVMTGGVGCGNELDAHVLHVDSSSIAEWLPLAVSDGAPSARSGHASVSNKEGVVYVFGGKKEVMKEPVIVEEPAAPEEAEEEAAPAEEGEEAEVEAAPEPAPAEEEVEEEELVYLNDLCMMNVDLKEKALTWTSLDVAGEAPCPRISPQMEIIDGKVLIYGGYDVDGCLLCDMYLFDPEEVTWRIVWNSKPPPDTKPTRVFFDVANKQLVVLDGSSGLLDAVETLDLEPLLAKSDDLIGEMAATAEKTLTDLEEFVLKEGGSLDTKVEEGDLDRLLKVMGALHDVLSQQEDVDLRMDSLTESITFLAEQECDVSAQTDRLNKMKAEWSGIKKRAPKIKAGIRTFQEREGRKIKHEIARFAEKIEAFRVSFKSLAFFEFGEGQEFVDAAYGLMKEQDVEIALVETRRNELAHLATLFECLDQIEKSSEMIAECREDLGLVKQFWDCTAMVLSYFEEYALVPWDDINTEAMEDATKKFKQELRVMNKKIRQEFKSYHGLLGLVNDQLACIPVVGELRQPCMRTRHWEAIVEMTKVEIDIQNIPNLKFKDLVNLELHKYVEDVGEIVDSATKEEKIENNLTMLESTWSNLEFEFTPYNDTEISLVKVSEETFETLEDNQVLVQNMAASRFVMQFQDKVLYWQRSLATVAEVIQILAEIQRTWSYLEDLFIHSEEVKRELPEDAERFIGIDEGVKEVLYECGDKPNLVERCNADGLYSFLEDLQHQLELCEKSLQDFMEAKKRAFPRFYFMSSKDLLDILSNGNRPEKVMEHIPKIFQAIQKLDLKDDVDAGGNEVKVALGMYSPQDEYVPFSKSCVLDGKVEGWLHRVIDHMRDALRAILFESNTAYGNMQRTGVIIEYQGQIVITSCQTWWCTEVEQVFIQLASGQNDAMTEYNTKQIKQITDLINCVRTKLTKQDRRKVMNIITLDSHARDIIGDLITQNQTKNDCFGWQGQLRYRWDENAPLADGTKGDCVINICDAEFRYAFEYLGNGPRLVITPLTDRLYITATQALHLVLGCAPAGPAGTGKTETTKDLASQMGLAVYVFNCSDQMDYRSVGDIFKGLASGGCWGCFDEFNRIAAEVLSVVTVQYKSILDAIKAGRDTFNFPGDDELVLNKEVGAFITMNPGYLGRTELPEGLKALFRPVTVMVPDLELICENMLMAEGYEEAKLLAHKFVILYALNKDLLSKQMHYDWGLRAIKSVLVVAGGFKREEPDTPEMGLLMRALRDFNVPKIVAEDMVVFMGLISDLFPNLDVPAKVNVDLQQLVVKIAVEQKLQPDENFVLKVCQLEELIAIRHCVFLMGPSGTGKSEVYKTLAKAWNHQGQKTVIKDINPKSIPVDELYGVISLATREWKDGLLSCILRDLSRVPDTNPKWLILDGDLDANWIESMNSVMDDNKLLTLASNERIPLLPHMRMLFEIRDLAYATPATVSRAGILFISPSNQWDLYIQTWIDRREDADDQKTILRKLFEKYVKKTLDYIRVTFKHLCPMLDFNMVQTLCYLLETLYTEKNKFNSCKDKMQYELFFCFAAVWAFGAAYSVRDGEDHRNKFSRWWRNEWRPVKFPDGGTVFDYFADAESLRFVNWSEVTKTIEFSPERPMSSVTVPTQETTGMSFWLETLVAHRRACLMVGYSGCGKTSVINGVLSGLEQEEYLYLTINFNYFTDSAMLQQVMEAPLEKKAGKNYGPPGSKKLVYFLDDLNMPQVDTYNTQTPIALLRQHMDYEHWFDREKLSQKNIGNCQYLACFNPAAGSFVINPRFQRHFVTFAVGFPGQDSLVSIYSTFLSPHLRTFESSVNERMTKLIGAGLELHQRVSQTFRKTAVKFHYEFNVRHLTSMFQGILMAQKEQVREPWKLVKLWLHESERTYGDLLVDGIDGEAFRKVSREVAKKYFPSDPDDKIFPTPNIFTHFSAGLNEVCYGAIPSFDKLSELLTDALKEYNENFPAMDLVLFEDAMSHVCRISRIIETGHALLVGVGGSGKQSLSRLASFVAGSTVAGVTITRSYGVADLKLDIMNMYIKAGQKGEKMTFLFTDSQITDERFLVFINDLLASGNIPDLFPPDEKENMINAMRGQVKAAGIIDTNENCWSFFIQKVVSNLHLVLCVSPVGENFRVRSRRFPALVNNTVIDWFHPWPQEALASVSDRFLGNIEGGLGSEESTTAIIKFMPYSFEIVNNMSATFLANERRHNYTTPKSFLELISLFKSMLATKRDTMLKASDRLQVGLDKLQATAKQVGELEEVLKVKSVEVAEKIAAAEVLSEKVGIEKKVVGEEAAAAAVEAEKCGVIKIEVTQKQEDCERDLAAALPAVDKAMAALDTLNKKDLGELKALKKPPSGVDDVLAAVMVLLSPPEGVVKDKTWGNAVKTMSNIDRFLEKLFGFKDLIDAEEVPKANFKAVRTYLKMDTMNVEVIQRKSLAAAGLCSWLLNICVYYDIVSDVEPKKRMLAEAIGQLDAANTKLDQVQTQVKELTDKLAELEEEFAAVVKEKEETVAAAEKMKMKMSMAQRLIAALASENVRWTEGVGKLQEQMQLLPGDCLVSAAFVSYVGTFSNSYRAALMDDNFLPFLNEAKIPMSPNPDPVALLADESKIAQWNTDGLPSDRVSVENGCIMTMCARWPLIIDPQMQGIVWIKQREAKNDLQVLRQGKKGMMDQVERAIEGGNPVLIENLAESIEATLGPIVGRQFIRKARRVLVKLGEKEVEVHRDFKLVLHTKLSNPHFPPEIQAETTLVNFTVTAEGLEDQLLARVVRKERPDLEEQKGDLISQQNGFKIQLKEIEDSLLFQLATAEGDLTENVELIENLEESKKVSTEIGEKAAIAAQTEVDINIAREKYRPVAARSSTLFFLLNNLFRIRALYLYSLSAFVIVFERAIDQTEPSEDLNERLNSLIETVTFNVWDWTRRGMFEKDKLIVATQLALTIMTKKGEIDHTEVTALCVGDKHPSPPMLPDNLSSWLTESAWAALHKLKELPAFADICDDVSRAQKPWKLWVEDEAAEKQPFPQKWNEKSWIQKLLMVRVLRPDRIPHALEDFVKANLGDRYIVEKPFSMQKVYEESAHNSPVFFLLFPGVNPYADVEKCGIENGYTESNPYEDGFNLRRISMGQGQEKIAEQVIDDFSKSGGWVYLDNVHLMSKWIASLERKLEIAAEEAHANFRCFSSAEPHPFPHFQWIPQGILESSIKVVNMPPSSLQANLVRAYDQFDQGIIDDCRKGPEMRGMLFSLSFFHACVVGRSKFGSQGWSRGYGFNFGDLTICGQVLKNYLNNNDFVPWSDIKYIQGQVMYGGHITDPWDRRVCIAYLEEYMAEGALSEFNLAANFKSPRVDEDYDYYKTYIVESFPSETPTMFGLHPNAEIGFLLETGSTVFSTILELKGNTSAEGAGSDLGAILSDLLERVPEEFAMHEIDSRVEDRNPYVCVVLQECDRMNHLLFEISSSLKELELGMAGSLNMSDSMETLLSCLGLNKVAPSWESKAYPSKKSLTLWYVDLVARVAQLQAWSATLVTPNSVWLTGLFNPMAYVTAILQTTARQNELPLDQMDIYTDVTEETNPALCTSPSEDGMFVHGLFMEGARWDSKRQCITESMPKELHPEMPVVRVRGVVHGSYTLDGIFICPVYITTMRGPTFVFKATLKSADPLNKWILAGVCLLMNED